MSAPALCNNQLTARSKLGPVPTAAIVTEWRFAPGAETGWHRHGHDYIVVVLTAGKLMQETTNGEIVTNSPSASRTRGRSASSTTSSIRTRMNSCSSKWN